MDPEIMLDTQELLSKTWITRIWTYQEIAYAQSALIVCGNKSIEWSQMALRIMTMRYMAPEAHTNETVKFRSLLTRWQNIGFVWNHMQYLRKHGTSNELDDLDLFFYYEYIIRMCYRIRSISDFFSFFLQVAPVICIPVLLIFAASDGQQLSARKVCLAACEEERTFLECSDRCRIPLTKARVYIILAVLSFVGLMSFLLGRLWRRFYVFPYTDEYRYHSAPSDLFDAVCSRNCGEPKDKFIGMHSIIERLLERNLNKPRYQHHRISLYTELAFRLVQVSDESQVLLAAALRPLEGAPSWVADWNESFPDYWLVHKSSRYLFLSAPFRVRLSWQVPRGVPELLRVMGTRLCRVDDCMSFEYTETTYQEYEHESHVNNIDVIKRLFDVRYRFNQAQREESAGIAARLFRDTEPSAELLDLLTDLSCHPDIIGSFSEGDLEELVCFFRKNYRSLSSSILQQFLASANAPLGAAKTPQTSLKRVFDAHIALCNSLHFSQRKIFSTTSCIPISRQASQSIIRSSRRTFAQPFVTFPNRFRRACDRQLVHGVCLERVEVGDQVVLIEGSKLPLIIREAGNGFRLINPAIVFDIMAGQTWPKRGYHYEVVRQEFRLY